MAGLWGVYIKLIEINSNGCFPGGFFELTNRRMPTKFPLPYISALLSTCSSRKPVASSIRRLDSRFTGYTNGHVGQVEHQQLDGSERCQKINKYKLQHI